MTAVMHAPSFTTRVGTSVVGHQQPDSLAMRNWAQIRQDPRSKFKDSYGPPSSSSPSRQHRPGRTGTDNVGNVQVEQLTLQLQQARTEIQQLRGALHYAGLALQGVGSWDKLPAELRCHLDQHHRMVDDLSSTLRERNDEVLRLQQEAATSAKALSHHRHVLFGTITDYFGNGALVLAWSAWMKLMRQKHRESDFLSALLKSKAEMRPMLLKGISNWMSEKTFSIKHRIFDGWHKSSITSRHDTSAKKAKEDRVLTSLKMWVGNNTSFILNYTWRGWCQFIDIKRQDDREQKLRQEHWEVTKQMQKSTKMTVAMAFATSSDSQSSTVVLTLSIRAWREYLTELKSTKAIEKEQDDAKKAKQRMLERHCVMLWGENSKATLTMCFGAWYDAFAREKLVELWKLKTKVFHAWNQFAKQTQRERELQRTRKDLDAQALQHKNEIHDQQAKRQAAFLFASYSQTRDGRVLLLMNAFSVWKSDVQEMKLIQIRDDDRERWRKEWEDQQQEHAKSSRARQVALAFGMANSSDEEKNALMLRISWNAWSEAYYTTRREKTGMDAAQRVFEDDLMKAQNEKESLQKEMKEMDGRHHKEQLERKLKLLLKNVTQQSASDNEMLVRIVWSAWRECMMDTLGETNRLRNELKVHAPHLLEDLKEAIEDEIHPYDEWWKNVGCLHRCLYRCCPCCQPRKAPKKPHLQEPPHRRRPSCWHRFLCRCCPCSKPARPIHPESAEPSARVSFEGDDKEEPQRVQLSVSETERRVQLSHDVNSYTKQEQHAWRCRAGMLLLLHVVITLGAIAANVFLAMSELNQSECDMSPISWLMIFVGNAGISAVVLVFRFIWFIGGMLKTNHHRVRASELAVQVAELRGKGELMSDWPAGLAASWHRELSTSHRKAEQGLCITRASSFFLCLFGFLFAVWSAGGWVMFKQSDAACESQKEWWPLLFGVMAFWALLTLIICCCSDSKPRAPDSVGLRS